LHSKSPSDGRTDLHDAIAAIESDNCGLGRDWVSFDNPNFASLADSTIYNVIGSNLDYRNPSQLGNRTTRAMVVFTKSPDEVIAGSRIL
jgi:hypothetical protein